MRNIFRVLVVVLILFGNSLGAKSQCGLASTSRVETGVLKGVVTDPDGARLLDASITIQNKRTKRTIRTNLNGAYETELPAGIYEISTEIPNWYPIKRANFIVRPGTTTTLTLVPAQQLISRALVMSASGSDEPTISAPAPNYDQFPLSYSHNETLQLVVQWSTKRTGRGVITYEGATASFDSLTVSAKVLRFYPRSRRIEAVHGVVVEEKGQQQHASRATLEFIQGEAVVKLLG